MLPHLLDIPCLLGKPSNIIVTLQLLQGTCGRDVTVFLLLFSVAGVIADIANDKGIPIPNLPAHYSKREDFCHSTAPLYFHSEPIPLICDHLSAREISALPSFAVNQVETQRSKVSRWLSHRLLPPSASFVLNECVLPVLSTTQIKPSVAQPELKAAFLRSQIEQSTLTTLPRPRSQNLVQGSIESLENLTLLSMEVFGCSRGDLLPNPAYDEIAAVFLCFQNSSVERHLRTPGTHTVIVVNTSTFSVKEGNSPAALVRSIGATSGELIELTSNEYDLFESVIAAVMHYDPDFILGYEVRHLSACFDLTY